MRRRFWTSFWPLLFLALAATVVLTILVILQLYPVYAAVDAQLDRAQISSNMQEMADNLEKVRAEMEQRGITHGHAAVLFHNPKNDVSLDYQAIISLRDRARDLSEADPRSVEYNVALDDMRGTAREIEIGAFRWAAFRNILFWIMVIAWITCFIGLSEFSRSL